MFGFRRQRKIHSHLHEIDPDEILLDATNLPQFNTDQFEGRLDKPISKKTLIFLGLVFVFFGFGYASKVWSLQITNGDIYREQSENNRLRHTVIFANRGIIYDRNDEQLAWNIAPEDDKDFSERHYLENSGAAHVVGFVSYPKKDTAGFYYQTELTGEDGIERLFDETLAGKNGLRIIETSATGEIESQGTIEPPVHGENIVTSFDTRIQSKLNEIIGQTVIDRGFSGGAGIIMDIHTGELIALTNYPEYDQNILTKGEDNTTIASYITNEQKPYLNRAVSGEYTPGSIIKPFLALAALQENVIGPKDIIISRGELVIPNPYNSDNPSIFTDWKAHGAVDMRKALAYSSNIYFYVVGGGFDDIKGLGINRIEEYAKKFGFGKQISSELFGDAEGTIPNPEWKERIFNGDPWRLGDTYFTSIGQYGFQVTPLQVVRGMTAIANKGYVINPTFLKNDVDQTNEVERLNIDKNNFDIVHAGMRDGVLFGTAGGLNISSVEIAAKTGTAELGVSKANVNSWVTGFFPYKNPRYAFVIMMERGKRSNVIGGVSVARTLFDWMAYNTPEYFEENTQ